MRSDYVSVTRECMASDDMFMIESFTEEKMRIGKCI